MRIKQMKWAGAGCVAVILAASGASAGTIQAELGTAANYTVLGINGNGATAGVDLNINDANATAIIGNLGIGPNQYANLQKATVTGTVTVDPSANITESADFIHGTQTVASLSGAQSDANNASVAYAALPANYTLSGVNTMNETFQSTGSTTVVDINGDVNVKDNTFTLTDPTNNGANDVFIVNITGTLSWAESTIVLSGGVQADNVLFNLTGTSDGTDASASLDEINKGATDWQGYLLAPFRNVRIHDNMTFAGDVIAEDIQIDSSATITGFPGGGGGASPAPLPLSALAGGTLLGGLAVVRRRSARGFFLNTAI